MSETPQQPRSRSRRIRIKSEGRNGWLVVGVGVVALWAAAGVAGWLLVQNEQPHHALAREEAHRMLAQGNHAGAVQAARQGDDFASWLTFQVIACCLVLTALMAWAGRDAKARGVEQWEWVSLFVAVSGGLFLLLYLAGRPSGRFAPCRRCGQWHLATVPACPYCDVSRHPFLKG